MKRRPRSKKHGSKQNQQMSQGATGGSPPVVNWSEFTPYEKAVFQVNFAANGWLANRRGFSGAVIKDRLEPVLDYYIGRFRTHPVYDGASQAEVIASATAEMLGDIELWIWTVAYGEATDREPAARQERQEAIKDGLTQYLETHPPQRGKSRRMSRRSMQWFMYEMCGTVVGFD
jgi:hypothetical protein